MNHKKSIKIRRCIRLTSSQVWLAKKSTMTNKYFLAKNLIMQLPNSFTASWVCHLRVFSHANVVHHPDGGLLPLVLGWYPLTIMCQWPLMSYWGSETCVSDVGNQYHNGPQQDQIFDNISAPCLTLWAKHRIQFQGGLMHTKGSLWKEYDSLLFLSLSPPHLSHQTDCV